MAPDVDSNRLRKFEELKSAGINPFPYTFDQTHHATQLLAKYATLKNEEKKSDVISVAGRIRLKRVMGKASFFTLQDQSGKIQAYLSLNDLGEKYDLLTKNLDLGDMIGVKGTIFRTRMGELTIHATEVTFLAKSFHEMPEKFHGLKDEEIRYRQRYLDLIVNPEVKEVFIKRAKIYKAIREFLDQKGFLEIRTPTLQTEYGGANARPFVTKINAWDMKMYLRIAYELHLKRLIVGGFEKIYDLNSCFRNEDADRTHNPEFAMMEIQWAYADYNDAMKLTEELWEYVAKQVNGTTIIECGDRKIDLKAPWKRLSMKEGLKQLAKIDVDKLSDKQLLEQIRKHDIEYEGDMNRGLMIFRLFEELCEKELIQPTHVIDHPKESCPLAKPHRKDPALIERVEPFINAWEVGNCYSELTDPFLQRTLLEEQAAKGRGGDDEAHPMDEDFVRALEYGLPPNTGIGIGIDRMVMLLTGQDSIRDVLLFPTMKPVQTEVSEKDAEKLYRSKKIVVIADESKNSGIVANAIGQLGIAIGGHCTEKLFDTTVLHDAEKRIHYTDSLYPMTNLAGSQKEMAMFAQLCYDASVQFFDFSDIMRGAHTDKQMQQGYGAKKTKDIEYIAVGALVSVDFEKEFLGKLKLFGAKK